MHFQFSTKPIKISWNKAKYGGEITMELTEILLKYSVDLIVVKMAMVPCFNDEDSADI